MQLTKYTDYAFRTLIFLGIQPPAELITITKVAGHFDIPRNHLVKIVHNLGKLGYVETVRGKGGGIRLARPASRISLREVVEAMEEKLEPVNCQQPSCPIVAVCKLKSVLADAQEAFLAVLGNYTLADLQHEPQQLRKLLKLHVVDG
ncbi:MAG: Rrf2 family transcriptional regulator [Motiliproteus sp.]|nr:Rrf2 family transcriptional regulator [Motiliproteus sp.]MCW9051314.1 Rrf2 family transcriptional regulator [Motiliproteus sp.]